MVYIGLYIHFPYCDVKCAYCDFYSIAQRRVDNDFYKCYIEHLKSDFLQKIEFLDISYQIGSIFLGGGTPSKVPYSYIIDLLSFIRNHSRVRHSVEITLEANPESLTLENLLGYREAGVNRIHVGIQTRNPDLLHYLGRLANMEAYKTVFHKIKSAGFNNFGCDFIYGIPNQTLDVLENDILWSMKEGVSHISAYCLTIEPNTYLERQIQSGRKKKPSDRRGHYHYNFVTNLLKQKGYVRYEVSNFALPSFASKHNRGYWKYRPYIGIGVAAHSFLGNKRFLAHKNLNMYLSGQYYEVEDSFPIPEIFIGIVRLLSYQSFNFILYQIGRYNFNLFLNQMEELQKKDYVVLYPKGFCFTELGILYSDSILLSLTEPNYQVIPVEPKP